MGEKKNSYDAIRETMAYWDDPKIETYVRWRTTHTKTISFMYGLAAGISFMLVLFLLFQ